MKQAYYSTISLAFVTQTIALNVAQMWSERPREVLLAGALALAGVAAIAGSAYSTPTFGEVGTTSGPPAPPPLLVRQLPVDQALAINQGIALDTVAGRSTICFCSEQRRVLVFIGAAGARRDS